MADQFVSVPNTGAAKVDTSELTVNVQTVERQRIVLADDSVAAGLAKVQNADPATSDYGLTVRTVGANVISYHKVAAASDNVVNIKASGGRVFSISVFNAADYTVYVKLYNKATTPAPVTDTPVRTFGVQAGTQRDFVLPSGVPLATGIGIAIVQGIADNDDTAVAVSDCVVDLCYT